MHIRRTLELGALGVDLARLKVAGPSRQRQEAVARRLAKLRGLPQKIGQILSLGELESDTSTFTALTEAPGTMPAEEAFAILTDELGAPLEELFDELDPNGIAASLGQVHRARLKDGRWVAIKLQYPGVRETLDADLGSLGAVSSLLGARKGFDVEEYSRVLGQGLREELDYVREAESTQRMARLARNLPGIRVPDVIDELCTERVLVTTWVDGDSFQSARELPESERAEIARSLLRLFVVGTFRWGLLHGDPHPGNYRFGVDADGPFVGVIDFGCVQTLSRAAVDALHGLLDDVLADSLDSERALQRFVALGFDGEMLAPMAERLPELARAFFQPFLWNEPRPASEWKLSERAADALGEWRHNFRFAGPPALIGFVRAWQGISRYLEALHVPIDWRALLDEVHQGIPAPALPRSNSPTPESTLLSKALHIRVRRDGRTRAEVTFAAAAVKNLPDLVPPDLAEKLEADGIDIDALARDAIDRGAPPGDLFAIEDADRSVRVWLE